MSKWISVIKDTPPDQEFVLVFAPDWSESQHDIAYIDEIGDWRNHAGQEMTRFVTHYQRLLKTPKK